MKGLLFDLRKKVQLLGTALYTSYAEDDLRLPVCVVQGFVMPEENLICFRVRRPYPCMDGMATRFYSTLSFYNKRFHFYLRLNGYSDVDAPVTEKPVCEEGTAFLCISMRITSVDYFASAADSGAGWKRHQLLHPMKGMLRKLLEHMSLALKAPMSVS